MEHPFTGVDYIEYYKELIQGEGAEVEIILGNNAQDILPYAKDVLACDIHTRGAAASGCCCKTVRARRWAWMIL